MCTQVQLAATDWSKENSVRSVLKAYSLRIRETARGQTRDVAEGRYTAAK